MMGIVAFSSWTTDTALALLMEDDRLALIVDSVDGELRDEVENLIALPQ